MAHCRRSPATGFRSAHRCIADIRGSMSARFQNSHGFLPVMLPTAAATGMSKTAINLAMSRTKAIPEDVRDQIKGTRLDTGVYLDWLKGMDPDDQRPYPLPIL